MKTFKKWLALESVKSDHLSDLIKIVDTSMPHARLVLSQYREPPVVQKIQFHLTKKPSGGLWYGFGSSWLRWLAMEMHEEKMFKYLHSISIDEDKICKIKTERHFIFFSKKFCPFWGQDVNSMLQKIVRWDHTSDQLYGPDEYGNYENVFERCGGGVEFDGAGFVTNIDIGNKNYDTWLSDWDVPSGVIWDPSVLKGSRLVAEFSDADQKYVQIN